MLDKFLGDLQSQSLVDVAQQWVIDRTPFIFGDRQSQYVTWKSSLAKKINVDGKAITFIGSASVGFSLNPDKSYREFDQSSDIDVAIISRHHFELAWHAIRNLGALRHSLTPPQRISLEDHRNRLIYWGTFDTKHLLPKLPFGRDWFLAFEEMTSIAPTRDRDINARIYRDFESLTAYHVANLAKLRGKQMEIERK
jgi:hypothetical protein